jgi:radical SAM superfamily enzyme YgiQ (UPF0313 family)
MKVRLIQPSQLNDRGVPTKYSKLFFPNLGLPTLAALTPSGIEVGITIEYVDDIDFDEDVDLVGITAQTCQAPRAYQIAGEFRRRGKLTVMGGIHASACPEEATRHVDAVLIGEAENIWETILQDARANQLKRLYQAEGKPDLARLVIPRYDLLDYNRYMIPPFAKTPLIPIQATRGCPHNCDFCSVTTFWGRQLRKKPVTNVVREIEAIDPSRIFFADDNICADPAYSSSLFAAIKPLRKRWACQMSTTIMRHPELIDEAADAGCHENLMGIESLNAKSLQSVHKGFNRGVEYKRMFKRLADAGILAQVSVIFGLDEDSPEDIRRTVESLLGWDVNYIYIAVLTPFPGTALYARFDRAGRIVDADWSHYDVTHTVYKPSTMSMADLNELVWEMYRKSYTLGAIWGRAWRFRKPYCQYFPRDNAIEELYFQHHIRNAVASRRHPFSLGLEVNNK